MRRGLDRDDAPSTDRAAGVSAGSAGLCHEAPRAAAAGLAVRRRLLDRNDAAVACRTDCAPSRASTPDSTCLATEQVRSARCDAISRRALAGQTRILVESAPPRAPPPPPPAGAPCGPDTPADPRRRRRRLHPRPSNVSCWPKTGWAKPAARPAVEQLGMTSYSADDTASDEHCESLSNLLQCRSLRRTWTLTMTGVRPMRGATCVPKLSRWLVAGCHLSAARASSISCQCMRTDKRDCQLAASLPSGFDACIKNSFSLAYLLNGPSLASPAGTRLTSL